MSRQPSIDAVRSFAGIAVSQGYAIGPAHFVDRRKVKVPHRHLRDEDIEAELVRFEKGIETSEEQIRALKSRLKAAGEEHYLILDAHQVMLRDQMLVSGTRRLITEQKLNAEWALKKVLRSIKQVFDNIDDEYFRERRADIDFVGDRLLRNLLGKDQPTLSSVAPDSIVIAHDLSPADTAVMMNASVQGFVTEVGGKTSHTAIMARSLELPAVVAADGVTEHIGTGDLVIIDGGTGRVIIRPTPEEVGHYTRLKERFGYRLAELDQGRLEPAVTADGTQVQVMGNIELPEETNIVLEHGAEGVGLYRTEYLFMNRSSLPTEDEQYQHFKSVLEDASPNPAIIRTLDLGGDKLADPLSENEEANPVMGLRAIRLCFSRPALFKTHLRALLRASVHGQLKIMVPLITSLEEIRRAKSLMDECRKELESEGVPVADEIPFGIMVEVPACALMAHKLADEVDFFSVGTNDLVQYTLAVDRGNQHVAHLYHPLHPALLTLLSHVIDSANRADIEVSMCGEMAGDPVCVPVLLGMGLRSLSMNPASIPLIKAQIKLLDLQDCVHLKEELENIGTVHAIESHVRRRLHELLDGKMAMEILDSYLDAKPIPSTIAERRTIESLPPSGIEES